MLKLIYDLKVGYRECYLTVLNEEFDVSAVFQQERDFLVEEGFPVEEPDEVELYDQYKDNILKLLEFLEDSGDLDGEREASILHYTKTFFSSVTEPGTCCGIWEPSNWRLVYDPDTRSSIRYLNAFTAHKVCDLLNLTKQQLHYYVKTGQIKKEFNPENPKQFKYNRTDVYVLQKKLEKKYDRYNR
jgi:hypothetical protein